MMVYWNKDTPQVLMIQRSLPTPPPSLPPDKSHPETCKKCIFTFAQELVWSCCGCRPTSGHVPLSWAYRYVITMRSIASDVQLMAVYLPGHQRALAKFLLLPTTTSDTDIERKTHVKRHPTLDTDRLRTTADLCSHNLPAWFISK